MNDDLLSASAKQIAGFVYGTATVLSDMMEAGTTPEQFLRLLWQHLKPEHQATLGSADQFAANLSEPLCTVIEGLGRPQATWESVGLGFFRADRDDERAEDEPEEFPLPARLIIRRLLADAAKERPGQQPAIECGVMLTGGTAFQGSLRERDDGTLELLGQPQPDPRRPGKLVAIEHLFGYNDVVAILATRDVVVEKPSIIFHQ